MPRISRILDRPRRAAWAFLAVLLVVPAAHAGEGHGTAAEARAMVAAAVAYYDEVGAEAAFAKFTDDPAPMFRDRDLYVFVIDEDAVTVAIGQDTAPSRIGRSSLGFMDADGVDIGRAVLAAAAPDGGWARYRWRNPATGEIEPKASWVVSHDGYVFGVGIYNP